MGTPGPAVQADIGEIGGQLPLEALLMAGIFRADTVKRLIEGLIVARAVQVAQLMINDGENDLLRHAGQIAVQAEATAAGLTGTITAEHGTYSDSNRAKPKRPGTLEGQLSEKGRGQPLAEPFQGLVRPVTRGQGKGHASGSEPCLAAVPYPADDGKRLAQPEE